MTGCQFGSLSIWQPVMLVVNYVILTVKLLKDVKALFL